jgi:glucosyl-dolichyl phosphate glucuronosyltransferase
MRLKDEIYNMNTRVSVIICSYNRARFILPALQSFIHQSSKDFELVFIDNNSPDNTHEICANFKKEYPEISLNLVKEFNQGHSFARNRGIREAKGELIAFVDDDVILDKDYVINLIQFFKNHPQAIAAGGKIVPHFEAGRPKWLSSYLEPLFACVDKGSKIGFFKGRKYPFGANMAFRASIFEEIGVFDTDLGRKGNSLAGADEKDLFQRIKRKGYPIYYIPDVWLLHIMPKERGELSYIRRQAIAVGLSERIRVLKGELSVLRKLASEIFKWGATIFLFFWFLFTIRPSKGLMLVRFRYWVLLGLLGIKKA